MLAISLLAQQRLKAQQVNSFSVKQAVDYAFKNSTKVKNALLDIQIQKEVNREITAGALPKLSGTASLNNYLDIPVSLIPAEIFGGPPGTFQTVQFGTKYNATGGLDITQTLFDGQVFVGLQARAASIQFYEKRKAITEELINVNLQKIYYQLVVGKQQMTSIDANIERFAKLLNDTKEIYNQGFAEKLDIDKVSVQLNNLETEKIKVQNQLDAGNAALKYLMNMPQKETLVLTDSLTDEQLQESLLNSEYQYTDRKEYQLLDVTKRLNEYNIKRYKLSYLPTLSAFGNYNKNAQRQTFDFFKGGQWFTTTLVGIRLNVPIFDGFAKKARVNQAKFVLQQTNNNVDDLRQSIDNDVAQAKFNISAALVTMDNQKKNMELAEKVFNTTKKKYEQGLGSNQEIYTAQTELKVAQNNYYGALYDAIIARIDFLKATGKL
ncbi:MAG: TolC family protein [Gloeobacteraceae cyanobacterium ES-bin-316]|nr:TolC family protein [Ferruginibacter sp.]